MKTFRSKIVIAGLLVAGLLGSSSAQNRNTSVIPTPANSASGGGRAIIGFTVPPAVSNQEIINTVNTAMSSGVIFSGPRAWTSYFVGQKKSLYVHVNREAQYTLEVTIDASGGATSTYADSYGRRMGTSLPSDTGCSSSSYGSDATNYYEVISCGYTKSAANYNPPTINESLHIWSLFYPAVCLYPIGQTIYGGPPTDWIIKDARASTPGVCPALDAVQLRYY